MASEKLMFGVGSIGSDHIYIFHTPKRPGIMPEARRDMTNECLGVVMTMLDMSGKHEVTAEDDNFLLYSHDPAEIEELNAVHQKYVKDEKDAEVRDETRD